MIPDIDAEVVEQHACEADYLWSLRDAAAIAPGHDLARLAELDERVEANLDGLRIAGDEGWEVCKALLEDSGAEAGAVFTAAAVAVDRGDMPGVAHVLDVGGAIPGAARGIAAAFGWIAFDQASEIISALLDVEAPPALQYLGIAASAAHRHDPGPALGYALSSPDLRVKARALRAVGQLGRVDLLPELRKDLAHQDEGCRFGAAWSASVFGEPDAVQALWHLATEGGPHAERAADMAMRRMAPAVALGKLHALAGSASAPPRAALVASAALGDPTIVPWLIECTTVEAVARVAGAAFSIVTGVDLRAEKLTRKSPARRADGDDVTDADEGIPWPDAGALAKAWQSRAEALKRGTRYLLGKPIAIEWLEQVLREGSQPARAAAALELSIREPKRAVFEVRAPGYRQQRALGSGGSPR